MDDEDIDVGILEVRDEFKQDLDSSDDEDSVISNSLTKSEDDLDGSSIPMDKDCYQIFTTLVNKWYFNQMPEQVEWWEKVEKGIKKFDKWHLEYRSYFKFQKEYVGYTHWLLTSKYAQDRFTKESIEKLIDQGATSSDTIIPVDDEVSHLQFVVDEYDEWFQSIQDDYKMLTEDITPKSSFLDDHNKYEKADEIYNQIKFLPLIENKTKCVLLEIFSISWLRRAEELMHDIRKRPFNDWISLAEEIENINDDEYLFSFDIFKEFEKHYVDAWEITELNSSKKAQMRRINHEDLSRIIEKWKGCKIYLEDEIETLTFKVDEFTRNQMNLASMMDRKDYIDKFIELEKKFASGPWIYEEEATIIELLWQQVEDLKQEIRANFDEFTIGRKTCLVRNGKESVTPNKNFYGKKSKKNARVSVWSMAEQRKARLNTIDDTSKSRKGKKIKESSSSKDTENNNTNENDWNEEKEESVGNNKNKRSCLETSEKEETENTEEAIMKSSTPGTEERANDMTSNEDEANFDESERKNDPSDVFTDKSSPVVKDASSQVSNHESESDIESSQEQPNTYAKGMIILDKYLRLNCRFSEGEEFRHKLETEKVNFNDCKQELWKIEVSLDKQLKQSFYTSSDISHNLDLAHLCYMFYHAYDKVVYSK
jgi:hypothetical protein